MKAKLFLITFLFTFKLMVSQTWSSGTPILKQVRGGNIAAYSSGNEGYLFIVSGREESGMIKAVQRYTVSTNTWDTLAPHPTGLLGAATTILGDDLYIIGGVINPPGFGQDSVSKFNISTNLWSKVARFPYAIVDAKAVAFQDSLIYVAGGSFDGPDSAKVLVYSSKTDSWRTATPIPSAESRNFGGFAQVGSKLVYMCGTNWFGSPDAYNTVYVGTINPVNRSIIDWKRSTDFPGKTRSFFDAHPWINNTIIMTGGSTDNTFTTWSDECYTFNPNTEIWTKLPNKPTAWLTGQSGAVHLPNSNTWKLICAGGYNGAYVSANELLTVNDESTAVESLTGEQTPLFSISQNSPNPFNSLTVITYSIHAAATNVTLSIHDALGKKIQTLVNEKNNAGVYAVSYTTTHLPGGVYYYTLTSGEISKTIKMVCVK